MKNFQNLENIFFWHSDLFKSVLEAALNNYSLYRCSTLSSTAEESITRRLRVTHAPHPLTTEIDTLPLSVIVQ